MVKVTNALTKLDTTVKKMPHWAKQTLYINLKEDLSKNTNIEKLNQKSSNDLIQNYIPRPTSISKMYINRKFNKSAVKMNLTSKEVEFLKCLNNELTIIEICNENKWSLAECCSIITKCLEKHLIEPINNNQIANTILFIGGKIRIGEYLIRLNKLSLAQLDQALFAQNQIKKQTNDQLKLGELLVNLGHIEDSEKYEVMSLKDTSSVSFVLEDETTNLQADLKSLESKINLLKFENEGIKDDLNYYQKELIEKIKKITELQEELDKHKSLKYRFLNFLGLNDTQHSLIKP